MSAQIRAVLELVHGRVAVQGRGKKRDRDGTAMIGMDTTLRYPIHTIADRPTPYTRHVIS